MRSGVVLGLVVVLVTGVPRLFDPATWVLLQAVRDLGPISGWRCAETATYGYTPSHGRPDSTLLADPPEAVVLEQVPDVEIDYVEANLRGGDSLVWSHLTTSDGSDDRRVYVLSPGRLQPVTPCNAHLADWRIVGEHAL